VDDAGGGGAAAIEYKRGAQQWEFGNDGGDNFRANFSGSGNYVIRDDGVSIFTANDSGITLGASAGSQITMNGATHTIANTPQVNTDVWTWAGAGGTLTNGTSIVSFNTMQASNLVATTTDGSFTLNSGTNQTMRLVSAGKIQLEGTFTGSTNTPSGINPAVNVLNTNGSQRLYVNVACAYGANSGTFLFASTAPSPKGRFFTPTAGVTNCVTGWINPGALWAVSNYVGTVTAIPGEGHIEVH
jgi:hypothetical protein